LADRLLHFLFFVQSRSDAGSLGIPSFGDAGNVGVKSYAYVYLILILILGIIFATLWLVKKSGILPGIHRQSRSECQIVWQMPVRGRCWIVLIQVRSQQYLLAITENSVTLLDVLEKEEASEEK